MSIFLDAETHTLFAYAEIESEERWEAISRTDVCRRWWASMRELNAFQPGPQPGEHAPPRGLLHG